MLHGQMDTPGGRRSENAFTYHTTSRCFSESVYYKMHICFLFAFKLQNAKISLANVHKRSTVVAAGSDVLCLWMS